MSEERYYMAVNPSGDICLVWRATGTLSNNPFPIMMKDEYGKSLPYTEKGDINKDCIPFDLNQSSEIITRIMISKEQFAEIGRYEFFCYRYNKMRRKIELRPGHYIREVNMGQWGGRRKKYAVEVCDSRSLMLIGIAYGGRPIYVIRDESQKKRNDFPELEKQGCLHPYTYLSRLIKEGEFRRTNKEDWLYQLMKEKMPLLSDSNKI